MSKFSGLNESSVKTSQARIKGLLKLGYPNTGAVIKACFNVLKAFSVNSQSQKFYI
jgi:hypothetical protein